MQCSKDALIVGLQLGRDVYQKETVVVLVQLATFDHERRIAHSYSGRTKTTCCVGSGALPIITRGLAGVTISIVPSHVCQILNTPAQTTSASSICSSSSPRLGWSGPCAIPQLSSPY